MRLTRCVVAAVIALATGTTACSGDSTDSSTTLGESVPNSSIEAFSFAEHDLCESVSADRVAEWVATEFGSTGTATPMQATAGCEWTVERTDADDVVVSGSDASLWQDFGGNSYDFAARMVADGVTEYPPSGGSVEIGAWVVGHPSLSDDVVVHNGGFGQFAFGTPPGPWLQVSIRGVAADWDDGVASEEYEAHYFAVADHFLRELGWVS